MGVDEDVRGFQTIVEMIRSINCPSLVQLGLVFTKKSRRATLSGFNRTYQQLRHMSPFYKNDWEEVDFTALFVDLVERLPKLVALLVVFPSATTLQCKAATATLESHFRPTRPCFRPNHQKSDQHQSTHVAVSSFQGPCSRSTSVGERITIPSDSL